MEAPGPNTVRDGEAGFCSEDNDDATAATLPDLRERCGLPRDAYVRWNVVPWAVSQRNTRARADALTWIENALRVGAAVALDRNDLP